MRRLRIGSLVALSVAGLVLLTTSAARGDETTAPLTGPRRTAAAASSSSVDLRDPSKTQILDLIRAFKSLSLDARATIDRDLELGPFDVDAGTQIDLSAGLNKRQGEAEPRLDRFRIAPSNPLKVGPIRLKSLELNEKGLTLETDLSIFGLNILPSKFTVEGGQRDAQGNLVLSSGGTGIVGAVAPRLRITPDGRLQFSGIRIPLIGVRILNDWRDVPGGFRVPPALTEFFARMPPTLSDLLDLLPVVREPGRGGGAGIAGAVATTAGFVANGGFGLESIPISDVTVHIEGEADGAMLNVPGGAGVVRLRDGRIALDVAGRLQNGNFVTDPSGRNTFAVEGTIDGAVNDPRFGQANIDPTRVSISGTHAIAAPLSDLGRAQVDAQLTARADGSLSGVRGGLNGLNVAMGDRIKAIFEGNGRVSLRPGAVNPADRVRFDVDGRFGAEANGPVAVSGLSRFAPPGTVLPDQVALASAGGPVVTLNGRIGASSDAGFQLRDAQARLSGATAAPAGVATTAGGGTLDAGSRIDLALDARNNGAGGLDVDADARLRGHASNLRLNESHGVTVAADGASIDLAARGSATVGGPGGTQIRGVDADVNVATTGSVTASGLSRIAPNGVPVPDRVTLNPDGSPVLAASARLGVGPGGIQLRDAQARLSGATAAPTTIAAGGAQGTIDAGSRIELGIDARDNGAGGMDVNADARVRASASGVGFTAPNGVTVAADGANIDLRASGAATVGGPGGTQVRGVSADFDVATRGAVTASGLSRLAPNGVPVPDRVTLNPDGSPVIAASGSLGVGPNGIELREANARLAGATAAPTTIAAGGAQGTIDAGSRIELGVNARNNGAGGLDVNADARVRASASGVGFTAPNGVTVAADGADIDVRASGAATVGGPGGTQIRGVSTDFDVATRGTVTASGLSRLAPNGVPVPDRVTLNPDGSPVVAASGSLGVGPNGIELREARARLAGATAAPTTIAAGGAQGTIDAGSRIELGLDARNNGAGGFDVNADARVNASASNLAVTRNGVTVSADGANINVGARGSATVGGPGGTQVRGVEADFDVATRGSVTASGLSRLAPNGVPVPDRVTLNPDGSPVVAASGSIGVGPNGIELREARARLAGATAAPTTIAAGGAQGTIDAGSRIELGLDARNNGAGGFDVNADARVNASASGIGFIGPDGVRITADGADVDLRARGAATVGGPGGVQLRGAEADFDVATRGSVTASGLSRFAPNGVPVPDRVTLNPDGSPVVAASGSIGVGPNGIELREARARLAGATADPIDIAAGGARGTIDAGSRIELGVDARNDGAGGFDVNADARVNANASNLSVTRDGVTVSADGATINVGGRGSASVGGPGGVQLRGAEADFDVATTGSVSASGLSRFGPNVPDRVTLNPDGTPVLSASGGVGVGPNGIELREARARLAGATADPITVAAGDARGTLDAGTHVELGATARPNATGGFDVDADARLRGRASGSFRNADGTEVSVPGATVDVGLSGSASVGGAERFRLRGARANGSVTVDTPGGRFVTALPNGGRLETAIGEGTSISVDTGDVRIGPNGEIATDGRSGRVRVHLDIPNASAGFGNLTAGFDGGGAIDLDTAFGLQLDPRTLAASGGRTGLGVDADVNLGVSFDAGASFAVDANGNRVAVRLFDASFVTLHTQVGIDPATGRPTAPAKIDGINVSLNVGAVDARLLLNAMGAPTDISLASRVTLQISDASVEFGPNGIQIRHGGVTFSLGVAGQPPLVSGVIPASGSGGAPAINVSPALTGAASGTGSR